MTATVNSELEQPDQPEDGVPVDIAEYVAAVRAWLVDLDADEIDDLTDDLHSHLSEIRADTDEPFEQVIGTPEQFATELRQSAGLAQLSDAGQRMSPLSRTADRLSERIERLTAPVLTHRWARIVIDFLPELRPAWWVARGYLLAGLLALVTGGQIATALVVPSVGRNVLIGFVVTVALIVGSVQFGRRRLEARWARWAAIASAILAGWVALLLFDGLSSNSVYYDPSIAEPAIAADGPFIDQSLPANIYAGLPDGTPVDQILLYDETGAPLNLPESGYSLTLDSEYEAQFGVDEFGRSIDNLYPRELRVPDWSVADGPRYDLLPPPAIELTVPLTTTTTPPPASTTPSSTAASTESTNRRNRRNRQRHRPPKPQAPATTQPPRNRVLSPPLNKTSCPKRA